ncbi:ABC transporter ATP-binding protein [Xanthobacter dioxanivorans]|uniref:ABC transporter ATP-binding protein n=1 Tax=Xanthobacter dioxanivorans TaxID=2528964 RepID=A0A974PNN2_9HYPH|nr:ABC transporter ATP-binding protein [Xanthobacter dioxanivorans]QRG06942.1 ABC transporter ATP-binding protein [Xanthobacter dioxanivorans]
MSHDAAFFAVEGVARSFGGFQVLADVSLAIGQGEVVGLLGPNGSGKTTLFNIATGFLPPSAGAIRFRGRDISVLSVQDRSRLGVVRTFQTPKVFEGLTVRDNVALGFYRQMRAGLVEGLFGAPRARREVADAREASEPLLARFGLKDLADTAAARLTAGQRRNLEVARALAGAPRLLMLDEPSTGLTRDEAVALGDMLLDLSAEGMTIFVVSHDMEFLRIVGRAHVLYFGRIIASGTLAEIQADPQVRQIYFGS